MKRLFLFLVVFLALSQVRGQNVSISETGHTPDASAGLDVYYNNRGILVPRLTQTERDAIASPAHSLLIFNLTSNCYEWWDPISSQWILMSCGGCVSAPSAPTANNATNVTSSSFTANWASSSGATYYELDVATDMAFTSFVTGYNDLNVGNVTSYSVTGLNCNTTYYYRVRACNDCGCSNSSNTITVTTANSIPSAPTANAATGTDDDSFDANWASSSGATYYELDVATDMAFTSFVTGYNDLNVGNVTTYSVTGLACNTTYYYRLRACNSCGCSGNSNTITVTTDACAASFTCKFMGGTNQDSIRSIVSVGGNYCMAGSTNSWGTGNLDAWFVIVNSSFDWSTATARAIGTAASNETITKMIYTSDGGYIAVGRIDVGMNPDILVIKLDASLNVTWARRYGGMAVDYGADIKEITGNNYIVVGATNSSGAGGYDISVMRLDNMGNISWQNTYGGTSNDFASAVIIDNNGRAAIAGATTISGNIQAFLLILNTDGTVHLQRAIGAATGPEMFFDLLQDTDNGYVCAGFIASQPENGYMVAGYENAYIVKFDNSGGATWTRSIGDGPTSQRLYSIVRTTDGSFVGAGIHGVMGYVTPNFQEAFFCKVTSAGAFDWAGTRGFDQSPNTSPDECMDFLLNGSGQIVAPINSDISPTPAYGQTELFIREFPHDSRTNEGCCQVAAQNTNTTGGSTTVTAYTPSASAFTNASVSMTVTNITFPMELPFPCAVPVIETNHNPNACDNHSADYK